MRELYVMFNCNLYCLTELPLFFLGSEWPLGHILLQGSQRRRRNYKVAPISMFDHQWNPLAQLRASRKVMQHLHHDVA